MNETTIFFHFFYLQTGDIYIFTGRYLQFHPFTSYERTSIFFSSITVLKPQRINGNHKHFVYSAFCSDQHGCLKAFRRAQRQLRHTANSKTIMFPPGLACFYQAVWSSTDLSIPFISLPAELQPSHRPVAHSIAELHAINLLLRIEYNLPSLPFHRMKTHVLVHFKHFLFFLAGVLFH